MSNFVVGMIVGLVLGVVATATAASLVGTAGYLSGWDVTFEGEVICVDPWVEPDFRAIDC